MKLVVWDLGTGKGVSSRKAARGHATSIDGKM